ncbi:MAG: hypothetical protein KKB65_05515 [Nanoarchaeota archaeon]|nr:hypothetical protein [Nanoarchaeota archaeon]MBU1030663.1 hypothetical protein [Nanoarchaeota archaeon]MBU1850310.1 hypothetical protein [Nanoarchaeota archaeon]
MSKKKNNDNKKIKTYFKEIKVKSTDLGDIISRIINNNYQHLSTINSSETKTWQIYGKRQATVQNVVYVSNHHELFVTETFLQGEHNIESVEKIVESYEAKLNDIGEAKKPNHAKSAIFTAAGAGILFLFPPILLPELLVGGAVGYGLGKFFDMGKVDRAQNIMRAYLDNHNVVMGEEALKMFPTYEERASDVRNK